MRLLAASGRAAAGELLLQAASTRYHGALVPMVVVTALLAWLSRPTIHEEIPKGFRRFQATYLSAWIFCASADWLQGPYVYALYANYGFRRHQIAELFVAGYVAAMVFSAAAGSMCDCLGRKRSALAYCCLMAAGCLLMHVRSYAALLLGRAANGFATSLLFSCFETWLVSEHLGRHGFSQGLLGYMFGLMYMSTYLAAIATGFVGEVLADSGVVRPMAEGSCVHWGGDLCPFELAIACLVLGAAIIACLWEENYGTDSRPSADPQKAAGFIPNITDCLRLWVQDRRVWLLCVVTACFESSMYAFIFYWTPALEKEVQGEEPPYGLIFALFMMACTCGSSTATLATNVRPASRLAICLVAGVVTFAAAANAVRFSRFALTFACFIVFEFCVGLYFPSAGVMKSEVVPERVRATTYNLYRVPMNFVVILLLVWDVDIQLVYSICASLLALGFCALAVAVASSRGGPKGPARRSDARSAREV